MLNAECGMSNAGYSGITSGSAEARLSFVWMVSSSGVAAVGIVAEAVSASLPQSRLQ